MRSTAFIDVSVSAIILTDQPSVLVTARAKERERPHSAAKSLRAVASASSGIVKRP